MREGLKLSDQEQKYYGDLFQQCNVDGSGRASGAQVSELFRASSLSQEVLLQVTELCGAKRLGHFGRSQFYIALKLIAAVQCGLPPTLESLNSGIDIPLPKFHRQNDAGEVRQQNVIAPTDMSAAGDRPVQKVGPQTQIPPVTGQLPPPPSSGKKPHLRNPSGSFVPAVPDTGQAAGAQSAAAADGPPPPETRSPPFSPKQSPPLSPVAANPPVVAPKPPVVNPSSADGPTVTTGPDPSWAHFDDSADEKHELLGTGTKKAWDHLEPPSFDSSSISSDPESVDDVWTINDEQRDYYVKQFQSMEPDVSGVIKGSVAREFFEKSKLPIPELSKIWQLSDINKDGALSLEEFCIAMHLVVLRRNEIEIPDRLPFALMPYTSLSNDEPFAADLPPGSTLKRTTPTAPVEGWTAQALIEESSQGSSAVSSPQNFEFRKPDASDPEARILHPLPIRVSPDGHGHMEGKERDPVDSSLHETADSPIPSTKQRANTSYTDHSQYEVPLQGRPRPLVKKNSVPGTMPGHILPLVPPSQSDTDRPVFVTAQSVDAVVSSEPPAPPPRPGQTHGRSMSVDMKAPPAVPPRITDGSGVVRPEKGTRFAEITKFESIQSQEALNVLPSGEAEPPEMVNGVGPEGHRRAVSMDYRKLGAGKLEEDEDTVDAPVQGAEAKPSSPVVTWDLMDLADGGSAEKQEYSMVAHRQVSRDKKDLHMAIRTHKERNSTLTRLNSELNQELQEVMEQRIALEVQLGHLRPFSS